MAKALGRANKLMLRSGANRPGATVRLTRRSAWAFMTGLLTLGALFAVYALYTKIAAARTVEKTTAAATKAIAVPTPQPVLKQVVTPPPAPTTIPRDPALEAAFEKLVLNGFRNDPPRVIVAGKLYTIGSELLPGLTLKEIVDGRTVVVEDGAGAIYRRSF